MIADDPAAPESSNVRPLRPVRSFVLRQGRTSPAQQRALDALLPAFGIPLAEAPLDFQATFGRRAPVVLEIGFGMGETTAAIAKAQPDRDFIGIEVHGPGVGSLLNRIESEGLTNVRVVRGDAMDIVGSMIGAGSLAGVHVFFPDPWPKKRHHKRRLMKSPFVHELALCLASGGYLHVATDWEDYARAMLETLSTEPLIENQSEDFSPRPAWRPETKFEKRGVALGHAVFDLVFRRR